MFGLFEGPSKDEKDQFGKITSASDFATRQGESDIAAGSKFMTDILSGDSSRVASALAPQIGAVKTAAQQQNKTISEFGSRSGGNTAAVAANNDKVHSDITDLIGKLTQSSASGLLSAGGGLLSTGISGSQVGFNDATQIQKQKAGFVNDIFGSALDVASMAVGGATGVAAAPAGASKTLAFLGGAF